MSIAKGISVRSLESIQGGMTEFYTPQPSDQTTLVRIPANTIENLFVHKHQTDQLLVVKGSFVLIILYNRQYKYIPLSEHRPQVVSIPPLTAHGAVNLNSEDCFLVNALLRHGPASEKDYRPIAVPFPYNIEAILNSSN
jgi:dTDP-4-dehydrorhamnose 3,5-epimerase-like enzyme